MAVRNETNRTELLNMDRLRDAVKAACRQLPNERTAESRRLEPRTEQEFKQNQSWTIRLDTPVGDIYAAELVQCPTGADGAVELRKDMGDAGVKAAVGALHDLWVERQPELTAPGPSQG